MNFHMGAVLLELVNIYSHQKIGLFPLKEQIIWGKKDITSD